MADAQVRQVLGIKQFFGLSRMTHSVLDVAHPAVGGALAAVLLGGPPSPRTIILGLIAGFAGYTSVFALNDVIDVKVDREKDGELSIRPRNLRSRFHGAASPPRPG